MYGLGLGNATAAAVAPSDVVLRETDLKIGLYKPLVRFRLNKSMSNWIAFKPVICTSPESDHSVQTQAKAIDGQQRFWAPLKQVGEGPEGRHDMRPNVEPHWFHTEAIPHLSTFTYSNSRFFPNLRREVCDILCERQRQIIKEAFLSVKCILRYV